MSVATAQSIMSRNPITCLTDDSLNAAAQKMWEHDIGALPVITHVGQVVGMITDRDIAMAAYLQGLPLDCMTVGTTMSAHVWSVGPRASLAEVEAVMREHQVRRIPVMDARNLMGMISLNDLARRAGPTRTAMVSNEEVAQTLSAVCEPRAPMMAE